MSAYEPKTGQICGFEIIGYRQKDGKIRLGNSNDGEMLEGFPKEIKTPYGTFQLEEIKLNDNEENQLPDEHPGKNIEWGVYV